MSVIRQNKALVAYIALWIFVVMAMTPQSAKAVKNPFHPDTTSIGVQKGVVTMKITINAPYESSNVKAWIPYPVSGKYQKIEDAHVSGNYDETSVLAQNEYGSMGLYAEWKHPSKEPREVLLTFRATSRERVSDTFNGAEPVIPSEMLPFIESTGYIPTNGEIGELAKRITAGKVTIAEKHAAIYDWMVINTVRDPDVQGCGLGIVERTLASKSGKCADLSSVYVALARAAGIPAREVFGLRLGKNSDGSSDMTKGHHCWAEYYQPGYGWVQTDPADVRKLMLANKIGLEQAKDIIDYYSNRVDEYRIALVKGSRGFMLNPPQNGQPLNYFMYPYAEVDGKSLDWLSAQKDLKYQISFTGGE